MAPMTPSARQARSGQMRLQYGPLAPESFALKAAGAATKPVAQPHDSAQGKDSKGRAERHMPPVGHSEGVVGLYRQSGLDSVGTPSTNRPWRSPFGTLRPESLCCDRPLVVSPSAFRIAELRRPMSGTTPITPQAVMECGANRRKALQSANISHIYICVCRSGLAKNNIVLAFAFEALRWQPSNICRVGVDNPGGAECLSASMTPEFHVVRVAPASFVVSFHGRIRLYTGVFLCTCEVLQVLVGYDGACVCDGLAFCVFALAYRASL